MTLRIITIGDPHLGEVPDGTENLTIVANYLKINNTKFDIVVVLGDYHDLASAQLILSVIGKPVKFVKGNHDGLAGCDNLISGFGDNVEIINGYQLLYIGSCGTDAGGPKMTKTYNYNLPTIVFGHYPSACLSSWDVYYQTGCNFVSSLALNNLLAVYAGHVHEYSNQIIGNVLYVTEDNLGGNGIASDYIGFTCIAGTGTGYISTYNRLNYKNGTTIPGCVETIVCNNPICVLIIGDVY